LARTQYTIENLQLEDILHVVSGRRLFLYR